MRRKFWNGLITGLFIVASVALQGHRSFAAEAGLPDSIDRTNQAAGLTSKSPDTKPETGSAAHSSGDVVYTPVGYGEFEVGQVASGYYKFPGQSINPISHVWQQRALFWLGENIRIKERLELNLAGGGVIAFSTPQVGGQPQTMQTRVFFLFKYANAAYKFLQSDMMDLNLQVGYFPFKYNPQVRNLGEYLFRTNAYPLIVYSDFDYPQADLLGAKLHCGYSPDEKTLSVQNDLLFHSELYTVPVQDWSLSDVASATFLNAFTIGAGISLCNWFSVYQGTYGNDWADQFYHPDTSIKSTAMKSFLLGDTLGDTSLFDWKSTKIMARFSVDFKRFLPLDIFGKNDMQLYGEVDVIGLKNYPIYFTDINDRTISTLGFNFPAFKFLDVANFELEYCQNPSAFSDERLFSSQTPGIMPVDLNENSSLLYKVQRSMVRWSAYLKKSIMDGHVSFIAQAARDHKKLNFYYFQVAKMSLMESLPTEKKGGISPFNGDWWWAFKTEFNF